MFNSMNVNDIVEIFHLNLFETQLLTGYFGVLLIREVLMVTPTANNIAPILFIPHGGGPLPLLGDARHRQLHDFLTTLSKQFAAPSAILVISAHWECPVPTLLIPEHDQHSLFFDYSGFPAESYQYQYPAKVAKTQSLWLYAQLQAAGLSPAIERARGLDHGVFVPLLQMFPSCDVPILQLSLVRGLNPAEHIALGEQLAWLRQQNIWIIGSGMSFHNMQAFFKSTDDSTTIEEFNHYLISALTDPDLSYQSRKDRLINWLQAPGARYCHPREEHLLPLHVCFGASLHNPSAPANNAKLVFAEPVIGKTVLTFAW